MHHGRHQPSTIDLEKLIQLFEQNLFAEAEQLSQSLITRFPKHGFAWKVLGVIYLEQKRYKEALPVAQHAAKLLPDDAAVFNNLGSIFLRLERFGDAELNFRRALAIVPDYAKALANLGSVLRFNRKLIESEECCRLALKAEPNYTNAHIALGNALELQNRLPEAQASYKAALAITPDMADLHTDLLHLLSLDAGVEPQQLFAEHLAFGQQFETPLRTNWPIHSNSKDPARHLQIGFVTGDLNDHALSNFLEPFFICLAQKSALTLHVYYTNTHEDAITHRVRSCIPHWHAVVHLSDAELASKICADGIDILIDLAGHTVLNRLRTFARKPAPIQASWLGYLGTTGLQAMDYYVCDSFWIPPGELDWQFTEKPAYLPAAIVFQPNPHAPPVNTLPALEKGHITFGSFNRINKINDSVVVLWSMLLNRIPNSQMVLGAIPPEFQERLIQIFEQEGIDRARLTFFPRATQTNYLALHHQVDFCLDTFPHGGGATTAHATWMGVPTLSLAGESPASRFGATEMHHLGLDSFIAYSIEEFIEKGCYWAENLVELSNLRQGMRLRFNESPLGQHQRFSDNFETMLRTMWQRWCNDLPPETLHIEAAIQSASAGNPSDPAEPSAQKQKILQDLFRQQRYQEAALLARQLIDKFPEHGFARKIMGAVLHLQGRLEESLAIQKETAELRPDDHEAHFNLACELQQQGYLDESVQSYIRALGLQPRNAIAYSNLGNIFKTMGLLPEAEMYCRQAIALQPDMEKAHNNLGNALHAQGKYAQAQASYRLALKLKPDWAEAYNNLAITLKDQGHWGEAKDCYYKALSIKPEWSAAHSNLLYCLSHDVQVEPPHLFAEHQAFGEQFETPLRADWQVHNNVKAPERGLHIGFVSGDLYDHALTNFLEPVFKFLSRKPDLTLHAYYTHILDDAATQRMRGYFSHWHAVAHLSDAELADQIRSDGIDILIDLAGHTAHNRLLTFARKPAPIQASWLGYLGSSGLQAMDYYLCDSFWIPPKLSWQFTEKPAYLPAAVVFQPSELAPPVNTLPALENGYITFGSFNRPNKLNESVIVLWSMLLKEVPQAHMVLGGMPLDSQETLLQIFACEGIAPDRLKFYPRSNLPDYLALHLQVDFCLDTFPYGGGATTAHAAWMGIPTLSLAGESPASRFGSAVMHQLGLDGFIATDIEDFIDKGRYWSENLFELANIRNGLRQRFTDSSLGQPELLANHFATLLRTMWRHWCDDQPPTAIEIESPSAANHNPCPATYQREPNPQELDALAELYNSKRYDEALASAQRLISSFPEHGVAWKILGSIYQAQERYEESVPATQRAIALQPDEAANYNNLGVALLILERLSEAEENFKKAIALEPEYGKAFVNLGTLFRLQGRFAEAQACCSSALKITPTDASAHICLGNTLEDQGKLSAAQASYYRADMAHEPRRAVAHSNVLYLLNHDVLVDPRHLFAEHVAFGDQFETSLRNNWQDHSNVKDPLRILQVGFVSGDLNHHALNEFLEPVFRVLGQKASLVTHAFYTHAQEDTVTQRMRSYFAHWHAVAGLDDAQLADKIRAEGIDILIDLSGHTAKNRLLTFARKPAPVQASWLGYLGTTGLQAMDYYLCDPYWIPPGELDWQFTEKLACLPAAMTFQPSVLAPPVNPLPAIGNGHITFGSFNRSNKINDSVIILWAMLMHKVPSSKLVLGAIARDAQEALVDSFAREGISHDRLIFYPRAHTFEYLALHHQVDFCLDTFPHGGGATTAHAAWMGVPTLCLTGETPASRFSAAMMHHLGLNAFIATSIESYVEQGVYWAKHIAELAQLRNGMRTRFNESALGQADRFANNLDAIFRKMWQQWCDGMNPNMLSIDNLHANSSDSTDLCHQDQPSPMPAENLHLIETDQLYPENEVPEEDDSSIVIRSLIKMALNNEEAGQLLEASHLYAEVLKIQPAHAKISHDLGMLEVKLKGATAALPRLEMAVQENPACEKYWVSYINVLVQSGAIDTAASALEWGQKYGLRSETAEIMAADFVAKLEKIAQDKLVDYASEELPFPPPWPSPKSSLTANLDYIIQPKSNGRRYVIFAPLYRHNSSGIRVLFDLQKWLVCSGFDAIIIAGTNGYPVDQFSDDIIIYPEVVTGNPLKAQRVVRYILNVPGKLGGTKKYANNELLLSYSDTFASYANGAIMMVPPVEPFFYKDDTPKNINAVYTGKEKDLNLHPKDCVYITREFPKTRREVAQFMRSVKTLYTYDLISAIGHEAMLCGCEVKFIRKDGIIEDFPEPVTLTASLNEFKAQFHDFIEMSQSL